MAADDQTSKTPPDARPGRDTMKRYHGTATSAAGPQTVRVHADGYPNRLLEHRIRHSPDGFQWGYGGSGPADLARSILWDHLGCEPDPSTYQAFKFEHVAGWGAEWEITSDEIDRWLTDRRVRQEDGP